MGITVTLLEEGMHCRLTSIAGALRVQCNEK